MTEGFVLSSIAGFFTFNLLTHPKSRIWKNLPHFKAKRIQFFPSIRITVKDRIIHFHHWFNFATILALSHFYTMGIFDSGITQGFLVGGMVQGLSIRDARQIIYKHDIYKHITMRSIKFKKSHNKLL